MLFNCFNKIFFFKSVSLLSLIFIWFFTHETIIFPTWRTSVDTVMIMQIFYIRPIFLTVEISFLKGRTFHTESFKIYKAFWTVFVTLVTEKSLILITLYIRHHSVNVHIARSPIAFFTFFNEQTII